MSSDPPPDSPSLRHTAEGDSGDSKAEQSGSTGFVFAPPRLQHALEQIQKLLDDGDPDAEAELPPISLLSNDLLHLILSELDVQGLMYGVGRTNKFFYEVSFSSLNLLTFWSQL